MLITKSLLFGIINASQLRLVTQWEVNPYSPSNSSFGMDMCGKKQAWHLEEKMDDPNFGEIVMWDNMTVQGDLR